jgi:hypothetical protein
LKKLGHLKGQEFQIILEDNNPNFKRPYKLSKIEKNLVQAQTIKLLDASLVKLSRGEYTLTIMVPTKKDIFGN